MSRFEVVFSGQSAVGIRPGVVKTNLTKLFQADARCIELSFPGRRVVIKGDPDATSAEKYRNVLEQVGTVAVVTGMEVEGVVVAPLSAQQAAVGTPQARVTAWDSVPPGRLQVTPWGGYMAAFAEVNAPDFDPALVGTNLQNAKVEAEAPKLGLSYFSVVLVDSDMDQVRSEPVTPAPDANRLCLQG